MPQVSKSVLGSIDWLIDWIFDGEILTVRMIDRLIDQLFSKSEFSYGEFLFSEACWDFACWWFLIFSQDIDWLDSLKISEATADQQQQLAREEQTDSLFDTASSLGRHRLECASLVRSGYSRKEILEFPADFFLMLSAIQKFRKDHSTGDSGYCVPATARNFDCLLSHSEEFEANEDRMQFVAELKGKLRRCLSPEEMPDDKEFLRIFGCQQINSFGIRSPFLMGIGEGQSFFSRFLSPPPPRFQSTFFLKRPFSTALYMGPSIFDHACNRNAVFLFDGTKILIKAIASIPSFSDVNMSGHFPFDHENSRIQCIPFYKLQVRISYTEIFVPDHVRQRRLSSLWFFHCNCALCNDKKLVSQCHSAHRRFVISAFLLTPAHFLLVECWSLFHPMRHRPLSGSHPTRRARSPAL